MWETEEEKKRTPGKFGDGERTCFHCGVFLLRGIFFSFFSSLAVIWRRVSEGREEEGSFALSSIFLFPFTPFPFAFAFALGSQGRLVMVVVASLRDGRDTETGKRILRWVMRERDMAFARIPGAFIIVVLFFVFLQFNTPCRFILGHFSSYPLLPSTLALGSL